VRHDGSAVAGNDGGVVELLSELWLTRSLGLLLRALRLAPLVDGLDDLIAKHRSTLGRLVPDGPAPRRYP
jgi:hypothetical protein